MEKSMILVSSCLLGLNTRYDGSSNSIPLLIEYSMFGRFIPICPEQLGGLPTPRCPCEIVDGSGNDVLLDKARVMNSEGYNLTHQFIKGAKEVIKITTHFPVIAAILKERSPSCGTCEIYDGSFNNTLICGPGVTSALLIKYSIPVYSEKNITKGILKKLLAIS